MSKLQAMHASSPATTTGGPMPSTQDLIVEAKEGDDRAREELFRIIRDHHMPNHVRKYRGRNALVSNDDIESHFLVGCYEALGDVDPEIGNPVLYMCWRGRMAVARHFKRSIRKGVRLKCNSCGRTAFGYKNRTTVCGHCGSRNVNTWMVVLKEGDMPLEEDQDANEVMDAMSVERPKRSTDQEFDLATYRIQVAELRDRLNGRVLQLFDKIVIEQINPQTSRNYLKEIAEEWGISTAAVSVYLRKLRGEVVAWLEENGAAQDLQ